MRTRALTWSEAEEARVAEVHRLAALGASAMPRLLDQLGEPSWTVRREVVASILGIGAGAVAPLCELLRTRRDSEAMIAAAVDTLAGLDADVLSEVAKLARDDNPAIAADAAQILGRRRSEKAIPLLRELVAHKDDNVAVAAIEALGRIGGVNAVDSLVSAVRSESFFRVFPAIEVLGRSGDPRAVPPLSELLANPTYVAEAATALGYTGQLAAVPALGACLASPEENVARNAAVALATIGQKHREMYGSEDAVDDAMRRSIVDPSIVSRLCRAMTHSQRSARVGSEDEQEHLAVIAILAAMGGDEVVACLTTLVTRADVADAAARALRKIGRDAERSVRDALAKGGSAERAVLLPLVVRGAAVDEIVLCTTDPDSAVRALACDALSRVGATSAVGALFELLADKKPRVQQAALRAIQSLGSDETKRLALRDARSTNPVVRRLALRILGYFGFPEALPVFIEAIRETDPRLSEAALLGLALLEEPAALDELIAAIGSPVDKTRAIAARALGHTGRKGDSRIADALRYALADTDAWVRYFACQAVGRLAVQEAVDDVTNLLRDDAGQVRVAAIEALAHLRTRAAFLALRNACEGDDADVQRAALLGLGSTQMPEGLVVLLRAAGSPDPSTRLVAISALSERGGPHVLPTLASAARDPDENVRAAAVGFLAALPGEESAAVLVDLLRTALRDGASIERLTVALARPTDDHVEGILSALSWADDGLAPVLVSCLARQRTAEAEAGLVRALSIDCVAARKAAATALGNLRTSAALVALKQVATTDLDAEVRRICHVLVGQ